jgi:hypothetical protein
MAQVYLHYVFGQILTPCKQGFLVSVTAMSCQVNCHTCGHVQVYEDMPQEMRSRFWYVLLERPDLAGQLLVGSQKLCSTSAGQLGTVGIMVNRKQLAVLPSMSVAVA